MEQYEIRNARNSAPNSSAEHLFLISDPDNRGDMILLPAQRRLRFPADISPWELRRADNFLRSYLLCTKYNICNCTEECVRENETACADAAVRSHMYAVRGVIAGLECSSGARTLLYRHYILGEDIRDYAHEAGITIAKAVRLRHEGLCSTAVKLRSIEKENGGLFRIYFAG